MGSPAFAVRPLDALLQAGHEIVLVLTQPDRPAGRRRMLQAPPVKEAALAHGLPIMQPPTLRDPEVIAQLAALAPDIGVVAAYGEILRKAVLAIPPLGYVNIHPSLLPLHRGPTPVAGAILAGEGETGVSLMKLDSGMDSGPILARVVVSLAADARAGVLTDELFAIGADLLVQTLPLYGAGKVELQPQDASQASYTRLLKKEDGAIDWSLPALVIERMTRAYDPWPGAYAQWRGQPLRVLSAAVQPDQSMDVTGTLHIVSGRPFVSTGSGLLELRDVQAAGKRPMSGEEWLRGQQHVGGERFGT
jgi:methionyl-tRNA formyltransferase